MAVQQATKAEKRRMTRELLKTIEQLMKSKWCRIDNVEGKLWRDEGWSGLERKPTGKNRITLIVNYTDTRRNPR